MEEKRGITSRDIARLNREMQEEKEELIIIRKRINRLSLATDWCMSIFLLKLMIPRYADLGEMFFISVIALGSWFGLAHLAQRSRR